MPTASQSIERDRGATSGTSSTPGSSRRPSLRRTSLPMFSPRRIDIQFPQSYQDHRYGAVRKYGPQRGGYIDITSLMKNYRSGQQQSRDVPSNMAPDFGLAVTSSLYAGQRLAAPLGLRGQSGSLSARYAKGQDHQVQLTPRLLMRSQSEPNLHRHQARASVDPYAVRFKDGISENAISNPGTPSSSLMGFGSDCSPGVSPTESEEDFPPNASGPTSYTDAEMITSSATSRSEEGGTSKGAAGSYRTGDAGHEAHTKAEPATRPKSSFKRQSRGETLSQMSDEAGEFMPESYAVRDTAAPVARALTATGYASITTAEGTVLHTIRDSDVVSTLNLSHLKTETAVRSTPKVAPRTPTTISPKTNTRNMHAGPQEVVPKTETETRTPERTMNGPNATDIMKNTPPSSIAPPSIQSSRLQQLTNEKKLKTMEPVLLFSSLPMSRPLTACFDHPGTDVTHRMVMAAVNRVVRTFESRVVLVQFVPRNVILGIGWCENRWLVTLDNDKAFSILTGRGICLGDQDRDRIKCRPYDHVVKEEYDRYLKSQQELNTVKKRKTKRTL